MVGRLTNSDTTNSFKAAKPIVKKVVYGLYNCDLSETPASLSHFVENVLKVSVISCFETNLYQDQLRTRAFRLCINAKDNASLLNPNHWADGIVIKAWRFASNNGPRLDVRATTGSTIQESSADRGSRSVVQPPSDGLPRCGALYTTGGGTGLKQETIAGVGTVGAAGDATWGSEAGDMDGVNEQQGVSSEANVSQSEHGNE